MNEVRKPELMAAMPDPGASFAQVSSDATRRLCEQGQSVVQTTNQWNAELGQFLTHRVARNGEAMGRMTQCRSLPEVFAVQTQWIQDAADDYVKEMSRLMEVNSRIMGCLLGSLQSPETPSSPDTGSAPAKAPVKATAG